MSDQPDPFRIWKNNRRVAVLGMASSGKTVFLTSLIDRILRRDGLVAPSMLGDTRWRIDRLSPADGSESFPYEYYRDDCLRIQRWPDKTTASSQFRLRRSRVGSGIRGTLARHLGEELTLYDIPGERVADFSMAGRSYAEWSDQMIGTLNERQHYPFARQFLQLDERDAESIDEQLVLSEYKQVLARFTQRLIPLVAPSTFLVDEAGRYPGLDEPPAHEQSVDDLVNYRLIGLDEHHQFAPMSERLRTMRPGLAAQFAECFDRYRSELADPLGAAFSSSDQMIVLLDVAAILENGPDVYHSTRKTLQLALDYLDPGKAAGERLRDLTMRLVTGGRWTVSGVRDLAIIASKADCVHRLDRSNLIPLVQGMTDDFVRKPVEQRGLRVSHFACAAIKATESEDEYPWLTGYVTPDDRPLDLPARYRFRVSDVPGEWPAESVWRDETFAYADPDPPPLDLLGREPFPGINMDQVAAFIGWPDPE